jgi:hypothetical protein
MTREPEELVFREVGAGQSATDSLEVCNYSEALWQSLSVTCASNWLTAQSVLVTQKRATEQPRQIWQVFVRADTTHLRPGRHETTLRLSANGGISLTDTCRVHLVVASPVQAIPGQFLFGSSLPGTTISKTVLVRFAPHSVPRRPDDVQVTHDLGKCLSLGWAETSGRYWKLVGVFTAPATQRLVDGKVTVRFPDSRLPDLIVPVKALIIEKE